MPRPTPPEALHSGMAQPGSWIMIQKGMLSIQTRLPCD